MRAIIVNEWALGLTLLAGAWLSVGVVIAGMSTSGCVRASAVDAIQYGLIPVVVGDACGDRHPQPHEANLFDLNAKYADVLTPGQKAMFAKYPTFRMDVYPTRRSASFPQRTYDYTMRNATSCKLVADGEGVQGCAEGIPYDAPVAAPEGRQKTVEASPTGSLIQVCDMMRGWPT